MWVNTQLQSLAREKPSVISYYIYLLSKKLPKKQMAIPLSVFIVNISSKGLATWCVREFQDLNFLELPLTIKQAIHWKSHTLPALQYLAKPGGNENLTLAESRL